MICARRLKVSKKLYIHTTTNRSSTGLSSELTIPMRQAVRMRERPRFM